MKLKTVVLPGCEPFAEDTSYSEGLNEVIDLYNDYDKKLKGIFKTDKYNLVEIKRGICACTDFLFHINKRATDLFRGKSCKKFNLEVDRIYHYLKRYYSSTDEHYEGLSKQFEGLIEIPMKMPKPKATLEDEIVKLFKDEDFYKEKSGSTTAWEVSKFGLFATGAALAVATGGGYEIYEHSEEIGTFIGDTVEHLETIGSGILGM